MVLLLLHVDVRWRAVIGNEKAMRSIPTIKVVFFGESNFRCKRKIGRPEIIKNPVG